VAKNSKPYEEDDEEEVDEEVIAGHCRDCVYWDPEAADEDISDESVALCLHADLEEYELRTSGDSSCILFEQKDEYDDDEDEEEEEEEEEGEEY
jgi:hypothetical protein